MGIVLSQLRYKLGGTRRSQWCHHSGLLGYKQYSSNVFPVVWLFHANQAKDIRPIQEKEVVVILSSIRPVCQLFLFGIIPPCGVTVYMHAHATLATLHHSLNHIFCFLFSHKQPWASGYSLCFVLKLSTDMHTIFLPFLACFSLFMLTVDACKGRRMWKDEL